MSITKKLACGVATSALMLAMASAAAAQSTGSQEIDDSADVEAYVVTCALGFCSPDGGLRD